MANEGGATGFRGERRFLSNFHPAPIVLRHADGAVIRYPTAEHAYQACKAANARDRRRIAEADSPGAAKSLGRIVKMRRDWDAIAVMRFVLKAKFQQHPDLRRRLIETDESAFVETNHWHDNFWGDCVCERCADVVGLNNLGGLLAWIRRAFISEEER